MSAPSYKQMIRDLGKDKRPIRLTLVKYARAHGVRAAMRHYGCARNTVRHWLREYEENGLEGLRDRSQAPHSCPPSRHPPAPQKQ